MTSDALKIALAKLQAEFDATSQAREVRLERSQGTARERLLARISHEPSLRSAIDDACRQWAEGRGWPMMSPDLSEFVWDRVVESRIFAHWLSVRGASLDRQTAESALKWLLVDYWVLSGCYRWRARVETLS